MRPVVLETEHLLLREWTPADADDFDRHCNTEAVMFWLDGVQTKDKLREDVEYFISSQQERGYTFWVVERKSDGAFLGFCGLLDVWEEGLAISGELEIGWRLREDVHRMGYGFEAARASLQYAFGELDAVRVVSRVSAGNTASRGLMAKLGMRHEPSFDYTPDGEDEPLMVYVIDRTT